METVAVDCTCLILCVIYMVVFRKVLKAKQFYAKTIYIATEYGGNIRLLTSMR